MIVFGHNSFLLNKCKPSQLGMSPDLDALYTIERRQRYFHLFWIPVFGIGKIWALRKKSDNNLYAPNEELETALSALPITEKTPWYTFSFLFLLMGAGAIFFISQTLNDYQNKLSQEKYRLEKNERIDKAIAMPQPFHYYDMIAAGNNNVYLKVLHGDEQNLTCLLSKKKDVGYSEYSVLEAFVRDDLNPSFDTVHIKKSDLVKTINKNGSIPFEGQEIIPGAGKFTMYELKIFDFPVFKNIQSVFEEGQFLAIIQNIGADAVFHEIKTETSNMTFEATIPESVKAGDLFDIKGSYSDTEPKVRSKFRCINSLKDSAEYDFTIYSSNITIKKSRR